jgi:hypothetical protein
MDEFALAGQVISQLSESREIKHTESARGNTARAPEQLRANKKLCLRDFKRFSTLGNSKRSSIAILGLVEVETVAFGYSSSRSNFSIHALI